MLPIVLGRHKTSIQQQRGGVASASPCTRNAGLVPAVPKDRNSIEGHSAPKFCRYSSAIGAAGDRLKIPR